MRRSSRIVLTLAITIGLFMPIFGQQTKKLSAEKHNEYGIVYSLPQTAFRIEVTAVKQTSVAGPFYKYAKRFAGDTKVIEQDEVKWMIESINVNSYGVPDREQTYLMQLKAGATTFIGVAEDGMLLSINKDPEYEPLEEISSGIFGEKPATGKEYLEYVDEDFISAQSSFKQAQLLGEELMEIRDAKNALTRGTAETMPTDGKQLEIMLASLDRQEKALMQAFTGSESFQKVTRTYTIIPEEEGRTVLFRFSDFNGFVDPDDYSGDAVYVYVNKTDEPEIPVDAKGEEKKLPKDAVMYCIPGSADLSVSLKGQTLYSNNFRMAQFGMNFGLAPSLFTDKKEPSYAIFDPATGALLELGVLK